jgi:hypothetical protein
MEHGLTLLCKVYMIPTLYFSLVDCKAYCNFFICVVIIQIKQ